MNILLVIHAEFCKSPIGYIPTLSKLWWENDTKDIVCVLCLYFPCTPISYKDVHVIYYKISVKLWTIHVHSDFQIAYH